MKKVHAIVGKKILGIYLSVNIPKNNAPSIVDSTATETSIIIHCKLSL